MAVPRPSQNFKSIYYISEHQILNDIISNSSKSHPEVTKDTRAGFSEFSNKPIAYAQNLPESSFSQELPDISTLQPHLSTASSHTSHLSSVFSSFSNILQIGSLNNNTTEEVVVPSPAGIESLIGQENNTEPVPLFAANSASFIQPKASPITGPLNQFRRSGLKRPVYAQIPGLSNTSQPSQNFTSQNIPAQNIPPLQIATHSFSQHAHTSSNFVSSDTSPTNSLSSTSSIEVTQNFQNQFKPISPPPPNLQHIYSSSQPLAPLSVQPTSLPHSSDFTQLSGLTHPFGLTPPFSSTQCVNLTTPATFTQTVCSGNISKNILSPVMDAIPASELSQSSTLGTAHINTVTSTVNSSDSSEANPCVNQVYRPVYHHWFFRREAEDKKNWQPMSMVDSLALEHAFTSNDLDPEKVISTDGGRYDVNILRRQRHAVYWTATPSEVRRCSWFYKSSPDGRLIPYEENIATQLEHEYKTAFELNQWHRTIELPGGETIVLHGPDVLVLYSPTQVPDAWGNSKSQSRPKVVKRGMDEFDIDEGEPTQVDHILFMVHGIGSVCDLKLRTVEEVVDEFRSIAFQLVQSHYRSSCDSGKIHRVEVLPISWHGKLHSAETGIDKQLSSITLKSIQKLRSFTNDTVLDILFYTSPVYCQNIISTVGNELNRIYNLFKQRNPEFCGGVSLGGHSLGSLILFDLLCHQDSKSDSESEESDDVLTQKPAPMERRMSKRISYMMGSIGTGQPQIHYPHLNFEPRHFFALGSPIGMFVIVRGLDTLGQEFSLPTCPAFFNIFHPYDPIAYRVESLIDPELGKFKPVLIPHHKGRKRMHLELKETMARVGADLKQKVIDSMKNTWNSVYQLAMFHTQPPPSLEEEVSKAFRDQLETKEEEIGGDQRQDTISTLSGNLNQGRRVDYVLQEAPFEIVNEYLSALTSHVCYWESEDTILLMLKEIYTSMGVTSDSQIPQQTMTIERPPSSLCSLNEQKIDLNSQQPIGMDPTRLMQVPIAKIHPPSNSGFVRKT